MKKILPILLFTVVFSFSPIFKNNGLASSYLGGVVIENDTYNNDIIIADRYSNLYLVHTVLGCYSLYEGSVIFVDSYSFDSMLYGEEILSQDLDSNNCEVSESHPITERLKVSKVMNSSDNIIAIDEKKRTYLIEYGVGCSRMSRYENKSIYLDRGGSSIDGIGDRLILPDDDGDCKVWDGEEIGGGVSTSTYYNPYSTSVLTTEPSTPEIASDPTYSVTLKFLKKNGKYQAVFEFSSPTPQLCLAAYNSKANPQQYSKSLSESTYKKKHKFTFNSLMSNKYSDAKFGYICADKLKNINGTKQMLNWED